MTQLDLSNPRDSYIPRLVTSLLEFGWRPIRIPDEGRLSKNRQLLIFKTPSRQVSLRVSIYKLGKSGRSKPHERRVEITTTYASGLERLPAHRDVVLGYDPDDDVYAALDPSRLEYGGTTHNASTFVDRRSLAGATEDQILVRPYPARILDGTEHQAYFRPRRLTEYFFNFDTIHAGLYLGDGLYSGSHEPTPHASSTEAATSVAEGEVLVLYDDSRMPRTPGPQRRLVEAYERGDSATLQHARLTPEDLEAIRRRCAENGSLGEKFVLDYERRRLRRGGRADLASKIEWIALVTVNEGYDISSFSLDGTERCIEVKATVGSRMSFDMSNHEWQIARALRDRYYIYRVTKVRGKKPGLKILQDPVAMEERGLIRRTPTGWHVTVT